MLNRLPSFFCNLKSAFCMTICIVLQIPFDGSCPFLCVQRGFQSFVFHFSAGKCGTSRQTHCDGIVFRLLKRQI